MPFATTTIVSSHKSVPGRSRHKRHEAFSKTQNFYLASREIQTMRGDGLLSPHVVTHISNFAASCSLKFQSVTIADRDQQRSASPESPRHAFAEFSARIRSESRCIHPLSPSLPPRVRARARTTLPAEHRDATLRPRERERHYAGWPSFSGFN